MNVTLKHLTGPNKAFGHMGDIKDDVGYKTLQARIMDRVRADLPPGVKHPVTGKEFRPRNAPKNQRLVVYINHGRVLVDCECGSGVIVDAVNEVSCCFSCGAVYDRNNLIFPAELAEVDDILGQRANESRNFDPRRETIEDLRKGIS